MAGCVRFTNTLVWSVHESDEDLSTIVELTFKLLIPCIMVYWNSGNTNAQLCNLYILCGT
jgi:hypothetical protein